MDNFTFAVLAGGALVVVVFGLMLYFDREKAPAEPAAPPAKSSGKR